MRYLAAIFGLLLSVAASAQGPYNLTAGVTITDPVPANSDSYDVEILKNGTLAASQNVAVPSAAIPLTGDTGDVICAQARARNIVLIGNWSAQQCITVPGAPADLTINFTLTGS